MIRLSGAFQLKKHSYPYCSKYDVAYSLYRVSKRWLNRTGTISYCNARPVDAYKDLAQRLVKLTPIELSKEANRNEDLTSIEFLTWISDNCDDQLVDKDLMRLGGHLMSIREGLDPVTTEYRSAHSLIEHANPFSGADIVPMDEVQLEESLRSSKRQTVASILGRKLIDKKSQPEFRESWDIPKRIASYLLTINSDLELREALVEAFDEGDSECRSDIDSDLDYLSTTPICLASVVSRWIGEQKRTGRVSDLDESIDLDKLKNLDQIISEFFKTL